MVKIFAMEKTVLNSIVVVVRKKTQEYLFVGITPSINNKGNQHCWLVDLTVDTNWNVQITHIGIMVYKN